MLSLAAYYSRVSTGLDPRQRALAERYTATRVGLDLEAWSTLLAGNPDLALLRELHRLTCAGIARVRRADKTGAWTVANTRPGHLRSQAQSFRAGEHVEPAWDHNSLARHVTEQIAAARAVDDPIAASAQLVWSLSRAQPFLGRNETTALAFAARRIHDAKLPVPDLATIEHDPAFARALAAPSPAPLRALFARAVWDAALAFAEWLAPAHDETARWTLADEHASCETARARVRAVADAELAAVVELAVTAMPAALVTRLAVGAPLRIPTATYGDRLRATVESARRGRHLCVHRPLHALRWPVASGLDAILVAGTAGRGLTGAAALHVALAIGDIATGHIAPGLLLLPDETTTERASRFATWLPEAVDQIIRDSPLRI